MNDSTSPTPSGIPGPSTSPTPTSPPAGEAASQASSSTTGASKKTTRRKTTSRRKSTRSRSRVKVEQGEASARSRSKAKAIEPDAVLPKITEDQVAQALRDGGDMLNGLVCVALGVDPDEHEWLFNFDDQDVAELKGPLSRVINKHAPAARVVQASDEILVTIKLGRWVIDNTGALVAARRFDQVQEDEPDAGEVARKVVAVPAVGGDRPGPGAAPGAGAGGPVAP